MEAGASSAVRSKAGALERELTASFQAAWSINTNNEAGRCFPSAERRVYCTLALNDLEHNCCHVVLLRHGTCKPTGLGMEMLNDASSRLRATLVNRCEHSGFTE